MGKHVMEELARFFLVFGVVLAVVVWPISPVFSSQDHTSSWRWERASATGSALQSIWFNPTCNPFCWTNGSFWTDGNALETLMNLKAESFSTNSDKDNWAQALLPVVKDIYTTQNVSPLTVLPPFFDDALWWGLAWLRAYQEYQQKIYLERSVAILETVYSQAWDTSFCGGGVWWSADRNYKNAITNELFIALGSALAVQTGNQTFAGWATQGYDWFLGSGMLNTQTNLINDGLNSTCENNGAQTWTYNQGVILGASANLFKLTTDSKYLKTATAIAKAALKLLVFPDDGVLTDPCDVQPGGCDNDGSQFKGVFVRHLLYFTKVLEGFSGQPASWRGHLANMSDILWTNARTNSSLELGGNWKGPFNGGSPIRQDSALDLLLFAASQFN